MMGWTGCLLILFFALFGVYGWNIGMKSHPAINALYSSTHRTIWSLGLAWLIYACVTGQGGFVNSFLAWKGFVPWSRLTFMVYLVHPWLIWLYMGNLRYMVDTSHYIGFYIFVPHWILSYLVGLLLTLLVESPVMVLQKEIIFRYVPKDNGHSYQKAANGEDVLPLAPGDVKKPIVKQDRFTKLTRLEDRVPSSFLLQQPSLDHLTNGNGTNGHTNGHNNGNNNCVNHQHEYESQAASDV